MTTISGLFSLLPIEEMGPKYARKKDGAWTGLSVTKEHVSLLQEENFITNHKNKRIANGENASIEAATDSLYRHLCLAALHGCL